MSDIETIGELRALLADMPDVTLVGNWGSPGLAVTVRRPGEQRGSLLYEGPQDVILAALGDDEETGAERARMQSE